MPTAIQSNVNSSGGGGGATGSAGPFVRTITICDCTPGSDVSPHPIVWGGTLGETSTLRRVSANLRKTISVDLVFKIHAWYTATDHVIISQTVPHATPIDTPIAWISGFGSTTLPDLTPLRLEIVSSDSTIDQDGICSITMEWLSRSSSTVVVPGFSFRGPWISTTVYANEDIVEYEGSAYISLSDSNVSNVPISSPTMWELFVAGVPSGGATGQVLTKTSSTDYATAWEDISGGVPAGGTTGQVLTKNSNTDYDISWENETGGVPTTRNINTTAPLAGGGSLAADLTLTVDTATTSALGVVQPDGTTIDVSGGGLISVPTATTGALGLVKPDGSTIDVSSGTISVPTATTSLLGLVKPDGSTIDVSSGTISVPTATTSLLGLVKPDGTTITISSGVISSTGGGGSYVPTTRDINTTAPLTGGGALSSDLTLAVSNATTGAVGVVKPDGSTITISSGTISVPTATTSLLGLVKPDGTTIDISSGTISVPTATTSLLGVVKPDGTSITISGGVLSASAVGGGGVPSTRNINTTAPLTGGGTLAADLTLAVSNATTGAVGVVEPDGSTITISSGVISVPTATTSLLGLVKPDGTSITISGGVISAGAVGGTLPTGGTAGQIPIKNSSTNYDVSWKFPPVCIAFYMASGMLGTDVAPSNPAPRAGTISTCTVRTVYSDPSTAFSFTITKNGSAIFTSSNTIAAATAADTISTFTNLTSTPITIAVSDLFRLNVSSNTVNWKVIITLE